VYAFERSLGGGENSAPPNPPPPFGDLGSVASAVLSPATLRRLIPVSVFADSDVSWRDAEGCDSGSVLPWWEDENAFTRIADPE